jgi:hypothetical protein
MNAAAHRWAVVFPATYHDGPMPVQYCALIGIEPLIRHAIRRAQKVAALFAVLAILHRGPLDQIFFVPAEYYFENEAAVSLAMNRALSRLSSGGFELALCVSPLRRLMVLRKGVLGLRNSPVQ